MLDKTPIFFKKYKSDQTDLVDIILIHGAGSTHLFWSARIRRLPGCRVFALDLPGHGKSQGSGYQSIMEYCDTVNEWMEKIKLPRAFICGHSMGGAIALEIALRYPEKVAGLGLISTAGKFQVSPKLLQAADDLLSYRQSVDMIIHWSFSTGFQPSKVALYRKQMLNTPPSVLYSDFLACDRFDVMTQLEKLSTPTIIICGEADRMTPLHQSQQLRDYITGATLYTIPDASHMMIIEQPQKMADLLSRFIIAKSR